MNRLINGLRHIRNRNRLVTFKARFHHAAFVMSATLGAVFIAEMHFDASDMLRQMAECVFHRRFGMLGQFFATFDVIV